VLFILPTGLESSNTPFGLTGPNDRNVFVCKTSHGEPSQPNLLGSSTERDSTGQFPSRPRTSVSHSPCRLSTSHWEIPLPRKSSLFFSNGLREADRPSPAKQPLIHHWIQSPSTTHSLISSTAMLALSIECAIPQTRLNTHLQRRC
jgi:hypothetical protein